MPGSRPCSHWAQFRCNFGDACGFSHDGPGGPSDKGIYPGVAGQQAQMQAQQLAAPDMEALVTQQVQDQLGVQADQLTALGVDISALVQQQLALQMAAGGGAAAATGAAGFGAGTGGYSGPTMGPCKHYAMGKCNFGDQCKYSHEGEGSVSPMGVYPGLKANPQAQMNGGGGGGGFGGGFSSQPCKHFQAGRCNFGDACKYSHDCEGSVSPMGVFPGLAAAPGAGAQAELPIDDPFAAFQGYDQDLGTVDQSGFGADTTFGAAGGGGGFGGGTMGPCKHFAAGRCNFGDACKFSHEGEGSVSPLGVYPGSGAGAGGGGNPFATQICTHFQQGRCNYGDQCKFSHDCEGAVSPRGVFPGVTQGMAPASQNVCQHFLKGKCTYGDTCKFSHADPNEGIGQDYGQDMTGGMGQEGLAELSEWASTLNTDTSGYQPY